MTVPLRDLLGQLADHETRASAATARDLGTEVRQLRTEIRRRRTGRIVTATVAAAAVVVIGIVTANAFTAPPPVQPAVPDTSRTVTVTPTPTAPTPSATPTASAPTTTPPAVVDTPPATLPQAADVTHGNDVWGAYVAVVDSFDSAAAEDAKARIVALGYEPSGGDVGCDEGAAETLGISQGSLVVASYFATEADAVLFTEMYGPDTIGVAPVTLFCLD